MFEASLQGLAQVFVWPNVGFMLLGATIGMIVGFIPGLGGNFMLAMMIPFVFGMDPYAAFALLLGGHAVVHTGGAISALLFNTPGTGPNAATCFDGYPLVKQGQTGRAMGIAMAASAFGGVFGALLMVFIIPIVRPIIMAFGPPEFFMMVMVGVAALAFLGGNSVAKGLAVGALGLLMSMVGQDPSTGVVRYGFGSLYLWDGINQVLVVIGIFAVSEMLELAQQGGSIADTHGGAKVSGGVLTGIKDVFHHWWLNLRCAAIGGIIGVVPGLGGEAASFLAYGHAVQTSKTPEKFGSGMIEGLIAPESAHNSKEGGALIPTVVFGVPGSSGMAILLGAFLILGLAPGPKLLSEHLPLVFNMAWTIAIANVVGAALGLMLANQMARLTYLRSSIIVPLILMFAVLGAYGTHNSMGDILVVFVFGITGYYLKKYHYPKAPLIMGLVLGRMAEVNLNMAWDLYGISFMTRPITLVLFVILIVTIVYPIIKRMRASRKGGNVHVDAI
ncbi:tripartite tricarboxylate transporter permease [Paradesulfitobacterium aromaticivorans]